MADALASKFRGAHVEPPPWLYARLARGALMRRIYRLFIDDLAGSLAPGSRLLDVGAGPGFLLNYLGQIRPDLDLWGLDCDYDMIRRVQPRPRLPAAQARPRWLVADACRLPFGAGVFHQVVATFTFHIWPCPEAGLRELRRVLRPGGQAWVYELRREVPIRGLRAFARDLGLPFSLVYLGYQVVKWQHALPEAELAPVLRAATDGRGTLRPAHHIFWRAELPAV